MAPNDPERRKDYDDTEMGAETHHAVRTKGARQETRAFGADDETCNLLD
jgi:hypothetical protein